VNVISTNGLANFTWSPADFYPDPNCNAGITSMGNTHLVCCHLSLFFLLNILFDLDIGYQLFIQPTSDFSGVSALYQGNAVSCTVAVSSGISYWMVVAFKIIDGITYSSTSTTGVFAVVSHHFSPPLKVLFCSLVPNAVRGFIALSTSSPVPRNGGPHTREHHHQRLHFHLDGPVLFRLRTLL